MENKWLIDCWLVNAQRQIWHAYLGQEQVQQVNIQMIQIWEKNRTIWTTIDLIIVLKIIGCLVGAKIGKTVNSSYNEGSRFFKDLHKAS
jgi:hypothetical protein